MQLRRECRLVTALLSLLFLVLLARPARGVKAAYENTGALGAIRPAWAKRAVRIASHFHYNAFSSPWMIPQTPFYLADHFVTDTTSLTAFFRHDGGNTWGVPALTDFGPALTPAPILCSKRAAGCDLSNVKENDVVFCRNDFFRTFVTRCLPRLQKRIVLITGRCWLPALAKDAVSEKVLADHRILKWYSQNPMYHDGAGGGKFFGFPYGVESSSGEILAVARKILRQPTVKSNTLFWAHHTVRRNQLGVRTDVFKQIVNGPPAKKQKLPEYYAEMYRSRYVLSLKGDRPECFRHWESIIFGAIPICNCHPAIPTSGVKENNRTKSTPHTTWFGKNLISLTTKQTVRVLNNYIAHGSLPEEFETFSVSADFVSFKFWCRRVRAGKKDKQRRCGGYANVTGP
ncbi:hypothetical protein T484DRAFT_1744084 [Baffinella frigidus]|nr:hypothetical protein T484DRAFT_1744084 [Cryptophyta sp. CCMP2293]